MDLRYALPGLEDLQAQTLGDPTVRVAVLDGPVDSSHPCFQGADLRHLPTLVNDGVGEGRMSRHGTHVASVIFGQPTSSLPGIAPRCRGLIVPIFSDVENGHLPQLDLARAIEQAVEAGANVINISGGERSPDGGPDPILQRALKLCSDNNVLVVAAAGNDGCACVHVPAAVPTVLAVGALGDNGQPLDISNWGEPYGRNGVLAPGERIPGASLGGGIATLTGTSFATPIVTGVIALLLSVQIQVSGRFDPHEVAGAILGTAAACSPADAPDCRRYLAGIISVPRAYAYISHGERTTVAEQNGPPAMPLGAEATRDQTELSDVTRVDASTPGPAGTTTGLVAAQAEKSEPSTTSPGMTADAKAGVVPRSAAVADGCGCGCGGVKASSDCGGCASADASYVYAIGALGFDFGTEARRDTFRQLMPDVVRDGGDGVSIAVSPNPYDVFQLVDYLNARPSESTKLIFTLDLDLTPIYAIEAERDYPEDVYSTLRNALRLQALPVDDQDYVSRLSIPGRLTGKTVQLFSGQRVPVLVAQPRGLYMWSEPLLVGSVVDSVRAKFALDGGPGLDPDYVSKLVRIFLDKVYFECRNLGQSSPDRALNFAATNAYQVASGIANGLLSGQIVPGGDDRLYTLDSISVAKSPYCRMDSDCWDVRITFFDPENDRRAKSVHQFTIDVSDVLPVSLAPAHQFLTT